jgi:O-6-methylguanine DNA methyltransferase
MTMRLFADERGWPLERLWVRVTHRRSELHGRGDALLTIPWGETRSYGQIAKQIGRPTASRAVGAANGRNPIAIIAPCHRVVGSTGKLTGFAGGLRAMAFLLGLEADVQSSAPLRGGTRELQPLAGRV